MAGLIIMPGFVFPATESASADPGGFRPLAGVGGGTTAKVLSILGDNITLNGQQVFGSYDAAGSAAIQTKAAGACVLNRPATEAAAEAALQSSMQAGNGCVDFARYTATPGLGTPGAADVAFVPLAQDSASFATTRTTTVPRQLSTSQLRAIYTCQDTSVRPMLPPKGTQLRALWLSMLSISESQLDHDFTCVRTAARENDPSVLDNTSIVPFSTAQFIGKVLRRNAETSVDVRLGTITGQTGGSGEPLVVSADPIYGSDVTGAVLASSDLPSTITFVQMQRIYRCMTTTIAGIQVYPGLPPKYTPLRQTWMSRMGISEADIINGDYPCLRTTTASPNDLRTLANNTIMPVNISEHLKQITGVSTDLRGGATLVAMDSFYSPGPSEAPIMPNLGYSSALVHPIGVGVPRAKLSTTPSREVFAGSASLVCQNQVYFAAYGFAPLPAGTCGGGTNTGQDAGGNAQGRLAGVGSTTTAAVMSTMSGTVLLDGKPVLASFDSSGKTPVETKSGCSVDRPKNDAQGIAQLNVDHGCLDYVRVSNMDTSALPGGAGLAFAPFALDSVTFAVAAGGTAPRTMTKAQLVSAYRCQTAGITPMLPDSGSQLRIDWLRFLGLAENQLGGCVRSKDAGGDSVIENDGRVLTGDAIVPFSVASYVAQAGSTAPDRRGRAVPGKVSDPAGPGPVRANTDGYLDDVTFAVRGDLAMPRRLSSVQLHDIYTCADTRYVPTLPASGVLDKPFAQLINAEVSELAAPCIVRTDPNGADLPANDGRTLAGTAIAPYSISAYLNQLTGAATDVRGSAVLGVLDQGGNPTLPIVLDTGYVPALMHHIYNAFPPGAANSSPLNETFVGPNSLICKQGAVIESQGFAKIPANDPQPCGVLQRQGGGPVQGTMTTLRAQVPADDGGVAGSGSDVTGWHGNCKVVGSFRNAPDGSSMMVTADGRGTPGARCRVSLHAVYFDQQSETSEGTDYPDDKTIEFTGSGSTFAEHSPGSWVVQKEGMSWIVGHYLRDVMFSVKDISTGAPSGESNVFIEGAVIPSVYGVRLVNPGGDNQHVEVQWKKGGDSSAYRIYRRDVLSQSTFQQIAQVPSDLSSSDTQSYSDHGVIPLHQYEYKVAQYEPLGDLTMEPSVPVRITPAKTQQVKHYVALGDSYSSGEGAGLYYGGGGTECHRSPRSYATRLIDPKDHDWYYDNGAPQPLSRWATNGGARVDLIACSGALARNVIPGLSALPPILDGNGTVRVGGRPASSRQSGMEPWHSLYPGEQAVNKTIAPDYQLYMLYRAAAIMPIDLVTISIGGNDVGFVQVLEECVLGFASCTSLEGLLAGRIERIRSDLGATYDAIAQASGDADINVIGYPMLFPNGGVSNCALAPAPPGQYGLTTAEMDMINRLGNRLNTVISEAVAAANERSTHSRFSYLDVRPTFSGHDMCSVTSPWIRQLLPGAMTHEAAHPNDTGWANEAAFISRTLWGTVG